VQGSGFRVHGSGFGVQGSEFRVKPPFLDPGSVLARAGIRRPVVQIEAIERGDLKKRKTSFTCIYVNTCMKRTPRKAMAEEARAKTNLK